MHWVKEEDTYFHEIGQIGIMVSQLRCNVNKSSILNSNPISQYKLETGN